VDVLLSVPDKKKSSRVAQVKNGFEPRVCVACEKPFEWRKKWARDWEKVKYCSERCRSQGVSS